MTHDEFNKSLSVVLQFSMIQVFKYGREIKYNGVAIQEVGNDFISLANGISIEYINVINIDMDDFLDEFVVLIQLENAKFPSIETARTWYLNKTMYQKSLQK